MKITFQHDHILPIKAYGGTERMLFWHMKELVKLGHTVNLIGHPQSRVSEYGISLIPMTDPNNWHHQIPTDTDLIHLFYNHTPPVKIPTINTVECNGKRGEILSKNSVFVSKKHAHHHGSKNFIYNGLDLIEYPFSKPKQQKEWQNFLFLAKGSWSVKNLKHCKVACKKSKKRLHVAGSKSILPSKNIQYYGMVGGERKIDIIKKCDALLYPVRWHEPFGMAIIEAMALGLPVIGSPYGSLPEIISKISGVICQNKTEFIDVVADSKNRFDPLEIRAYIENNFTVNHFTTQYLELYQKLIKGETLSQKNPSYALKQEAVELLPF